jgi:hypothetical protein
MKSMHKCASKRPRSHMKPWKSGDSGDAKATSVATYTLLRALALGFVFAFVASVASQKKVPHEGFDKNRGRSFFISSSRMGEIFLVATVATMHKNNIYLF